MVKKDNKKANKKSADFDHLLIDRIFELSRKMRATLNARLQKLELYGGQERIIFLLQKNDGLAPSQIADKLGVTAPTIAKSINRLAARGIVVRRPVSTDKRRATIHLTTLGHSVIKAIKKEQKMWRKKLFSDLQKRDKKNLIGQLGVIEDNLSRMD